MDTREWIAELQKSKAKDMRANGDWPPNLLFVDAIDEINFLSLNQEETQVLGISRTSLNSEGVPYVKKKLHLCLGMNIVWDSPKTRLDRSEEVGKLQEVFWRNRKLFGGDVKKMQAALAEALLPTIPEVMLEDNCYLCDLGNIKIRFPVRVGYEIDSFVVEENEVEGIKRGLTQRDSDIDDIISITNTPGENLDAFRVFYRKNI